MGAIVYEAKIDPGKTVKKTVQATMEMGCVGIVHGLLRTYTASLNPVLRIAADATGTVMGIVYGRMISELLDSYFNIEEGINKKLGFKPEEVVTTQEESPF